MSLSDGQLGLLLRLACEDWPAGLKVGLPHLHGVDRAQWTVLLLSRIVVERNGLLLLGAARRRELLRVINAKEVPS
jgi:hypothetical protein